MKALIRKSGETVLENDNIPCIDWETGTPLTNPKWAGGPYNLVQNYIPPKIDDPTQCEEVIVEPAQVEVEEEVVEDDDYVIIDGKKIWESQFDLLPGDHIMFFSDGILYADTEMQLNLNWGQKDVEDFLAAAIQKDDPARECTRILLAMVNSLYGGKPTDDCTVAAARILPATETVVMAGPPLHKEDDEKVMQRLLHASRQKIVCGGTTSQIAAAYLQTECIPDSETPMLDDVPPKAFIKGIDLVTEGQLTLQKVSFLFQKALKDRDFYEEMRMSKEQDGASCLFRALAESTAVTFVMGLSENKGHQSIAGVSLNAKKMLIQSISNSLNELGKFVSIEMY